jgi:phosphoenolpyruvate phosphomutase
LIHSKASSPSEILEFVRAWDHRAPLVVVPTTYPGVTVADLEAEGVRMVIYANHGIRASIAAMEQVFARILDSGSTSPVEDSIAPMSLVFELQGMPQMKQDEKAYLRSGRPETRAVIPAAGDHLNEHSMTHIAEETPMAMLDVNGKPILQHQLEALQKAGIADVTVVGGYRADRIQVEGVNLVLNPGWASTGIAASFLAAHRGDDASTLMLFSDVLFSPEIVERLLQSDKDITLAVRRYSHEPQSERARAADLVSVAEPPSEGRRILDAYPLLTVASIGKTLHPAESHCEFIGLAAFSEKGVRAFRETYEHSLRHGAGGSFHEATSVERGSFTDVIQEIIDRGHTVHALQVSEGWLEIHSFDDYREACMQLARS